MTLTANDSTVIAMLSDYRSERDAWLAQTWQMLENDPRVVAAWLFGSLGRGTADDLSDVDILVVLDDACADAIMSQRQEHIRAVENPLLLLDAPQNRPPDGAYNMALYKGRYGPHQVDWYWQPQSHARVPTETRLLFDHISLPRLDTPPHFDYQPVPERTQTEAVAQAVNFFWVMLLIAAKYAARKPAEGELGLLSYAVSSLREVRAYTQDTIPLPFADDVSCLDFAAKLRLMRVLANEMERQMPVLEARNVPIPAAIAPSAHRYLDFVEMVGTR